MLRGHATRAAILRASLASLLAFAVLCLHWFLFNDPSNRNLEFASLFSSQESSNVSISEESETTQEFPQKQPEDAGAVKRECDLYEGQWVRDTSRRRYYRGEECAWLGYWEQYQCHRTHRARSRESGGKREGPEGTGKEREWSPSRDSETSGEPRGLRGLRNTREARHLGEQQQQQGEEGEKKEEGEQGDELYRSFGYEEYRWQPSGCSLPAFNAPEFLSRVRHRSIAFAGDSLSQQQFLSLLCLLTPTPRFIPLPSPPPPHLPVLSPSSPLFQPSNLNQPRSLNPDPSQPDTLNSAPGAAQAPEAAAAGAAEAAAAGAAEGAAAGAAEGAAAGAAEGAAEGAAAGAAAGAVEVVAVGHLFGLSWARRPVAGTERGGAFWFPHANLTVLQRTANWLVHVERVVAGGQAGESSRGNEGGGESSSAGDGSSGSSDNTDSSSSGGASSSSTIGRSSGSRAAAAAEGGAAGQYKRVGHLYRMDDFLHRHLMRFHLLVLSTGHHWTHDSFQRYKLALQTSPTARPALLPASQSENATLYSVLRQEALTAVLRNITSAIVTLRGAAAASSRTSSSSGHGEHEAGSSSPVFAGSATTESSPQHESYSPSQGMADAAVSGTAPSSDPPRMALGPPPLVLLRTLSPAHFAAGTWSTGGRCDGFQDPLRGEEACALSGQCRDTAAEDALRAAAGVGRASAADGADGAGAEQAGAELVPSAGDEGLGEATALSGLRAAAEGASGHSVTWLRLMKVSLLSALRADAHVASFYTYRTAPKQKHRGFGTEGAEGFSQFDTVTKRSGPVPSAGLETAAFNVTGQEALGDMRENTMPGDGVKTLVRDCVHWCLPGVPDTWNELLYAELIRSGNFTLK